MQQVTLFLTNTRDGWKKTLSFLLQKAHVKVKSPDESANQENLLYLRVSTYPLTFLLMKKMIIKTFWLKEAISGLEDAFLGAGAGAHAGSFRSPRHSGM